MLNTKEAIEKAKKLEFTEKDMINLLQFYIYTRLGVFVRINTPQETIVQRYGLSQGVVFNQLYVIEVQKMTKGFIYASEWIIKNLDK